MNDSRTKRLPKIILTQIGIIILIALIGSLILFYANGYHFNFKTFKIKKNGVVYLSSYPRGATVYLDGEIQSQKTPYSKDLLPGYYTVRVVKDGYQLWSANFKIEEGLVDDFDAIVLYKSKIIPKELTDEKKIALLNISDDILSATSKDQIKVTNDEIWQNGKLVTRFSQDILNAIWYPDGAHILYQRGNEIRSIEITGFNDTLLVTLSNNDATEFATNESGNELYYLDKNVYKVAEIR